MVVEFDRVLDECIDRITIDGETVESCLVRHEKYRSELEPLLRTAAILSRVSVSRDHSVAKQRGRQLLAAARVNLDRNVRPRERRPASHWWDFRWAPRWVAATAAALVVVMVAGTGSVFASSGALPGDTLYPVKRSAEQVQLALSFAPTEKAKLHMSFAERRARELAALVEEGKDGTSQETVIQSLNQNLASAASIAGRVDDDRELESLRSDLKRSTSRALDNLQAAVEESPEKSRHEAQKSLESAGQAYGHTLEKVMDKSPGPSAGVAATATGLLQLLVTDPAVPNVDEVLVSVTGAEAHLSSPDGWITITTEPQTFDLQKLAGVHEFLAQKEVPAGTYTQVRVMVSDVTVVSGGTKYPVNVPSGNLSLVRPFTIEPGKATLVVLDFDGARSLNVTGNGEFTLKPVVNVMVKKPSAEKKEDRTESKQADKEAARAKEEAEKAKSGPPVAPPAIGKDRPMPAGPQATGRDSGAPPARPSDERDRAPAASSSQASTATQAAVAAPTPVPTSVPAATPTPRPLSSRDEDWQSKTRVPAPLSKTQLEGKVETAAPEYLVVKGKRVSLTSTTVVNGKVQAGSQVRIEASILPDGSFAATSVTVQPSKKSDGDESEKEGKQKQNDSASSRNDDKNGKNDNRGQGQGGSRRD